MVNDGWLIHWLIDRLIDHIDHFAGDDGVHGVHENDVQDDRDGSAGGEVGGRDGFVQRACSKLSEVAETKRIQYFGG